MAKLRREAKTLKLKALQSLRRGIECFNSFDEEGRITTTLLHLQHSGEMLLKAVLVQNQQLVFDKKQGTAIGFEKCVNICKSHCGLTDGEAGALRAIDSMRDAAQHWIIFVDEELLFLHARAFITVFDDVLKRSLFASLAEYIPTRVLPLSSSPPRSFDLLVDLQYTQIQELLKPGRRARDEARGRIRSLLAMEAHVANEVSISEKDIDRVEAAARSGKAIADVFPRLQTIEAAVEGTGLLIKVHFTKKQGAPVKFVKADDPQSAAAVREIDLQNKFYLPPTQLAKAIGLSAPRCRALIDHLDLDRDSDCHHVFNHGKSKFPAYSDNAARKLRDAIASLDLEEVWQLYRAKSGFGVRQAKQPSTSP